MTSLQQLFQLSVSIAFNFLGNWVALLKAGRWEGRKGREKVRERQGREWFKPERVIFFQV